MGEKGDEVQLLSFLNALLRPNSDNPFTHVDIIENTTINPKVLGDKKSILDVRAKLSDHTKTNIEVQLRNLGDMAERSLYYWSREFASSLKQGSTYIALPKIISINIVNFKYTPYAEYHTTYHLREDTHTEFMLTDRLEIHFIDMVEYRRLKAINVEENGLHRWLTFFDNRAPEELRKKVVNMDIAIQKAHDKIAEALRDEEAVWAYEVIEKAEHDYASEMDYRRRFQEETEQIKQRAEEAKQHAEEAKQRAEEAKQRAEHAKQRAEEAEQRAEQVGLEKGLQEGREAGREEILRLIEQGYTAEQIKASLANRQ
jgi:predicted transposase/invertase (TIGR01784 family)